MCSGVLSVLDVHVHPLLHSLCLLGTTVPPDPALLQMSQESRRQSRPTALLIPTARGGRARRAMYLLLALSTAVLYLAGESLTPTARSLVSHFVALQIGVLLKGICYLAEEIFHLQSR